jgi:hypothetical protein
MCPRPWWSSSAVEATRLLLVEGLPVPAAQRLRAVAAIVGEGGHPHRARARLESFVAPDSTKASSLPKGISDREFFVEDSSLAVECRIGGALHARIQRGLEGVMMALALAAYLEEQSLHPLMRCIVPEGHRIGLAAFLERLWGLTKVERRLEHVLVLAQSHESQSGGPSRLRGATLDRERLVLEIPSIEPSPGFARWLQGKRVISSIDLMLDGSRAELERGEGTLVINETHVGNHSLPATSIFPYLRDARASADLVATYRHALLPEDAAMLQPYEQSKSNVGVLMMFAGAPVIVQSLESWLPPGSAKLPIAEVAVNRRGDEYDVVHEPTGRVLQVVSRLVPFGRVRLGGLDAGLGAKLAKWASCSHIRLAPDVTAVPEVRLAGVVVGRRKLMFEHSELLLAMSKLDGTALVPFGRRLLDLGLARWTYVATAGQKPFLCDLTSVIGLETLANHVQRHGPSAAMSPMLPAPGGLWLELPDGPHASELRFAAVLDG